jgi:hypothetical protein
MLRVVSDGRSLVADLNAARNEASASCLQSRDDRFGFSDIKTFGFSFVTIRAGNLTTTFSANRTLRSEQVFHDAWKRTSWLARGIT